LLVASQTVAVQNVQFTQESRAFASANYQVLESSALREIHKDDRRAGTKVQIQAIYIGLVAGRKEVGPLQTRSGAQFKQAVAEIVHAVVVSVAGNAVQVVGRIDGRRCTANMCWDDPG